MTKIEEKRYNMHWMPLKVLWEGTWSRNYELAASTRKHRLFLLMQSVICKQQLLTRENERKTQSSARCYFTSVIYSAIWSMMRTKSPISSGSHECFKAAVGAPGYLSYTKITSIKEESRFIPLGFNQKQCQWICCCIALFL